MQGMALGQTGVPQLMESHGAIFVYAVHHRVTLQKGLYALENQEATKCRVIRAPLVGTNYLGTAEFYSASRNDKGDSGLWKAKLCI